MKTTVGWEKVRPLPQPVPRGGILELPTPRHSTLGLGRVWRGLEKVRKGWRGQGARGGSEGKSGSVKREGEGRFSLKLKKLLVQGCLASAFELASTRQTTEKLEITSTWSGGMNLNAREPKPGCKGNGAIPLCLEKREGNSNFGPRDLCQHLCAHTRNANPNLAGTRGVERVLFVLSSGCSTPGTAPEFAGNRITQKGFKQAINTLDLRGTQS